MTKWLWGKDAEDYAAAAKEDTKRPFGFRVEPGGEPGSGDGWWVYLPHSCDEWMISYADDDQTAAIARFETFIAEAQAALAALRAGRPFNGEDVAD